MPESCCDSRYLPIAGYKPFINSAVKLALGDDNAAITEGRVAAIQSLSGTGACRVMAEFMHRFMPGGLLEWLLQLLM
jgi:aspartate aminotransferase, mitochondrial